MVLLYRDARTNPRGVGRDLQRRSSRRRLGREEEGVAELYPVYTLCDILNPSRQQIVVQEGGTVLVGKA